MSALIDFLKLYINEISADEQIKDFINFLGNLTKIHHQKFNSSQAMQFTTGWKYCKSINSNTKNAYLDAACQTINLIYIVNNNINSNATNLDKENLVSYFLTGHQIIIKSNRYIVLEPNIEYAHKIILSLIENGSYEAHLRIAFNYLHGHTPNNIKDSDLAIQYLNKLLALTTDTSHPIQLTYRLAAYAHLIYIHTEIKRSSYELALKHCEAGLKLPIDMDRDDEFIYRSAYLYQKLKQFPNAIKLYEDLLGSKQEKFKGHAAYNLYRIFLVSNYQEKCWLSLLTAVRYNHAQACYEAGLIAYRHQNYNLALQILTRGNELHNPGATYELARFYQLGIGVKQDKALALKYITTAAENGHAQACGDLFHVYRLTADTDETHQALAAKWFKNAINCYHEDLKKEDIIDKSLIYYQLGALYKHSTYGYESLIKAKKYYLKAISYPYADIISLLKQLEVELSTLKENSVEDTTDCLDKSVAQLHITDQNNSFNEKELFNTAFDLFKNKTYFQVIAYLEKMDKLDIDRASISVKLNYWILKADSYKELYQNKIDFTGNSDDLFISTVNAYKNAIDILSTFMSDSLNRYQPIHDELYSLYDFIQSTLRSLHEKNIPNLKSKEQAESHKNIAAKTLFFNKLSANVQNNNTNSVYYKALPRLCNNTKELSFSLKETLNKKASWAYLHEQPQYFSTELITKNFVSEIIKLLHNEGYSVFEKGGSVRNRLAATLLKDFNEVVNDWDIITNAHPQEVYNLLEKAYPGQSKIISNRFPIVKISLDNIDIDISTFRNSVGELNDQGMIIKNTDYGNLYSDAKLCDFTINSLYYNFFTKKVLYFHNAITDIENKTIRYIGDPLDRIMKDPITMLRAVRFASQYEFIIEKDSQEAISNNAARIKQANRFALYHNINKLFFTGVSQRAFELLGQLNLLFHLFPALAKLLPSQKDHGGIVNLDGFENFLQAFDIKSKTRCYDNIQHEAIFLAVLLWKPLIHRILIDHTYNDDYVMNALIEEQANIFYIPFNCQAAIKNIWKNQLCIVSNHDDEYNKKFQQYLDFYFNADSKLQPTTQSGFLLQEDSPKISPASILVKR